MQLYHTTQISLHESTLMVSDLRVLHQMKRVMRSRIGDAAVFQMFQGSMLIRYHTIVSVISDKTIEVQIQSQEIFDPSTHVRHLVVAMSNKWDKMELIVQKAAECGVTHVTVVPMHRSVIRQYNDHKWSRLQSIMVEAVEQSWSTSVPVLQWYDDINSLTLSGQILLANMGGQPLSDMSVSDHCVMVVGPEGGLDPKDITQLEQKGLDLTTISLGSTVLRMETATIVGSWWMNI